MRLNPLADQLPEILELGLREWIASGQAEFSGLADVLEFLAALPSAEEILILKPTEALQQQVTDLLTKAETVGLTDTEEQWWQHYEYAEHLVRIAKARALLKLQQSE
ncbi:MAG: hypothetical protein KME20_16880 [Kaiparowitsia implicata GSE-PSE-MK54-09C]|nr:hypothetical protein [Kaiparowitsia implicata GSE-PSE-MK54-09C]